jgi:PKD repeat protein
VRRLIELLCLLLLGLLAACNSTNPVAPDPQQNPPNGNPSPGSGSYQISIAASPAQLVAGSTEPATLSIAATRTDNNQPAASGTKCAVSTSLGSFDAAQAVTLKTVLLDGEGKASLALYPSTTTGTATVLAQIDTSLRQLSIPIHEADQTFFITSVSPSSGEAKAKVTITGAGFVQNAMRVTFGKIAATSVTVASPNLLTAIVPPPAAEIPAGEILPVDVTITKPSGAAAVSDTLQGGFIYTNDAANSQPRILAVIPASGPNEGGTAVTLRGDGFVPPVQVFFGFQRQGGFDGVEATVTAESETLVAVTSPAAAQVVSMTDKKVDILLRNRDTGASTIASGAFQYGGDFFITDISPDSGPYTGGTKVYITGKGFQAPVEVKFGGVTQRATEVTATKITVVTAAVPVAACNPPSGPVSVTNLSTGKTAASARIFTYTAPKPNLTQVTNSSGPQAGGNNVTISGSGFDSAVRVEFGGVPSQNVSSSSGVSITAAVPAFTGTLRTEPCDDNHDGTIGVRNLPTAVDVKVTNTALGCADTLGGGYTYNPTDASCRNDVGAPTIKANFTWTVTDASMHAVQFFDTSTGNPVSWSWTFSDLTSSFQANPMHTFQSAGSYTVSLTVTNSAGASSTVTKEVTVP